MRRVLGFSMVALIAALLAPACGSGDTKKAPPIVLPTKDTVKPTPDVVVNETETGPELIPNLEILGVVGLDDYPTLFCGGNIKVLVGAENIGGRELRLFIPANETDVAGPVLGVSATLESGSTTRYIFTLDGSKLAAPPDVDPPPAGLANLIDGKKFLLGVAAFDSATDGEGTVTLAYPKDPLLRTQREFIFDNTAPVLKVTAPNLGKSTPTMSGLQPVLASVTDNQQVGRFEAYFNGELVLEIEHTVDQIKTQPIDANLDLRDELTAAADLEFRAFDACGLSTTLAAKAKVIAHPFLRTFERTLLPPKTAINDSEVVDWDGDGYPDMLFATTIGIVLALNDGEAAPGQFSDIRFLTSRQTSQVAVADLDADGDLDIVSVQSVASIGNAVAVQRQITGGSLLLTETHALPISSGTVIRDLIVADFTNDPPDTRRGDIALITSSQSESIILFKRQRADEPAFSDQCDEIPAPVGDATADADVDAISVDALAIGDTGAAYVCKELFSPPTKAGGIEGLITAEVVDLSGDQGEPDGFLDLVVASESHNQINVFANRFFETNLLDTAFSQATVSFVWPVPSSNAQDVKYFCTGNFIEEAGPGPDRIDVVAGTESSGTWRVLRNIGDGKFQNSKGQGDPYEIWDMSGATNASIKGLVCGDFDLDGHADFAVLSQAAQILEIHLGNGQGRFNQVGDPKVLADQLQNPVNEGVGFTTGAQAQNLKLADFNQDGLLDFAMDFRDGGFGIFINRTNTEQGFDLEATRALLTPLGKQGSSNGGQIQKFTVANITGDSKPEVIAFSSTRTYPTATWLREYHPLGALYRNFLFKGASSPTMFVWTQGHYGLDEPSWPAAYDRFPAIVYPVAPKYAGPVTVNQIKVLDLATPGGEMKPDGKLDVLVAGGSVGTPQSVATLYINTSSAKGFWDPAVFAQITAGALFSPYQRRHHPR
jgi:hypothetical protein